MRCLWPFQILWGAPRYDTRLRSCTGHIRKGDGPWTPVFAAHTVHRWYGIAFKRQWLIGFVRFGLSEDGRDAGNPAPPAGGRDGE